MTFEMLKKALCDAAAKAGVTEYEIYYQTGEDISAETLKDEISAFSSSVGGGVCFRCIVNGKMGFASGELLTEQAMEDLVKSAISSAAAIDSEDEVFIFPGSDHYATIEKGEVALLDPFTIRKTALDLQKATYAASDEVGDGTQCVAVSTTASVYFYNSHGLELHNTVGVSGGYAAPVVRRGEEAQSDFEFGVGASYEEMKDLPAKAVAAAASKFGAGLVPTGKYDVVFDGKQFRSILSAFSDVFSAKAAQKGLSLLAGKEGEVIASPCVTITDDPMREGCPMQTSFDGEGVATYTKAVVEKGVLKTLLYDLTTAHKAGRASTGNAQKGSYAAPASISPFQFSLNAGDCDEDTLFGAVDTGIYITECKGFHAGANAVTGDFSIESAGFMIRDGKVAEPVKSFTIAGNFFELLKQIERVSDTVKWGPPFGFTNFGSPNVLVRQMSVAGK